MGFTTPAFIRKNTTGLRMKLEKLEEAARKELVLSHLIVVYRGGFKELLFNECAMLNMFRKGAEWALSEVSNYIRNCTSFDEKAWDMLPFIKAMRGDKKALISYLEDRKKALNFELTSAMDQRFMSDVVNNCGIEGLYNKKVEE